MRIARNVEAVLAGIVATVVMTAAMEFGRRSGLLRRRLPEEITDQLPASAGTTKATREQLANPRLHFRWLEGGGSISKPLWKRLFAVRKPRGKSRYPRMGGLK